MDPSSGSREAAKPIAESQSITMCSAQQDVSTSPRLPLLSPRGVEELKKKNDASLKEKDASTQKYREMLPSAIQQNEPVRGQPESSQAVSQDLGQAPIHLPQQAIKETTVSASSEVKRPMDKLAIDPHSHYVPKSSPSAASPHHLPPLAATSSHTSPRSTPHSPGRQNHSPTKEGDDNGKQGTARKHKDKTKSDRSHAAKEGEETKGSSSRSPRQKEKARMKTNLVDGHQEGQGLSQVANAGAVEATTAEATTAEASPAALTSGRKSDQVSGSDSPTIADPTKTQNPSILRNKVVPLDTSSEVLAPIISPKSVSSPHKFQSASAAGDATGGSADEGGNESGPDGIISNGKPRRSTIGESTDRFRRRLKDSIIVANNKKGRRKRSTENFMDKCVRVFNDMFAKQSVHPDEAGAAAKINSYPSRGKGH